MNNRLRMFGGPILLGAALIVARLIFPTKMNFITEISIFSIYVMGCNILYGYLGMVSFGQPFYLGVGAYTAAIYLAYLGHNPLISILLGVFVGFLIGLGVRIGVVDERDTELLHAAANHPGPHLKSSRRTASSAEFARTGTVLVL